MSPPLENVLTMHTDPSGSVWVGHVDEPVRNTGLDAADFINSDDSKVCLDGISQVRVLGTVRNAQLITRLYERQLVTPARGRQKIILGSPSTLPVAWLDRRPADILRYLLQPPASSNLAWQWHEMARDDYVSYGMIVTLGNSPDDYAAAVPDVTLRYAEYHPAWPMLTFLTGTDLHAACRALCTIVDPRWYMHPNRPGRLTRLHTYLGVTPNNLRVIAGDTGTRERYFNRAALLVKVWYNTTSVQCGEDNHIIGQFSQDASLAVNLMKGTKRLLWLVNAVWLDVAVRARHQEVRLDPETLFPDKKVAAAFREHTATYKTI